MLKRRVTDYRTGRRQRWNASSPYPTSSPQQTYTYTCVGSDDLLSSEGHDFRALGKSRRDLGGGFHVIKRDYAQSRNSDIRRHYSTNGNPTSTGRHEYTHQYAAIATVGIAQWPVVLPSSPAQLDALGATAIARCIPTNPLSGLSTAIGEIREGLPSLVGSDFFKSRLRTAKAGGSEYLNVEFGWKPLLSDIRKFQYVRENADRITREYERNSGKLIRRRYEFPTEKSVVETQDGLKYPVPYLDVVTFYSSGQVPLRVITTSETKRWFEGAFTYYLPPVSAGSNKRDAQIANKLYGTRVTPGVLWELTPWSWAADWVGNFGDVIHNVGAFRSDGLVMPFAYMMEQKTVSKQYILENFRYRSYSQPETYVQTLTTTVKYRRKATPYGFGLDTGTFSNRQWAILSALGISRGRGQL